MTQVTLKKCAGDLTWLHMTQVIRCSCVTATATVVSMVVKSDTISTSVAVPSFYGPWLVSSSSTRQEWSVSRTRNGGWYSNAVKMEEPPLCFWCQNQITTETPIIATTLRMTRAVTNTLGSEEQQRKDETNNHKGIKHCNKGLKLDLLCLTFSASEGEKKQTFFESTLK